MKRLLFVGVMLSCFAPSVAQEFTFTTLQTSESSQVVLKKTAPVSTMVTIPGLRMRNAGRTLTICGGVLFIGGVVMMNNADELYYTTTQTQNGTIQEGDPKGALGVLMTVGGIGMAVPGIILWSKGQKKYNRYLERQTVSMNVEGTGLSLRYSF
jgi:hypothetical protein